MRRWIVVLIILLAALGAAGCTGTHQTPQQQEAEQPEPSAVPFTDRTTAPPPPTPISQAPVSANTITISGYAFIPQTITVKKGEIVRWENMDATPHRIMFTDASGRDTTVESTVLSASQSYSRKFDRSGTYPYYCKIHPDMKGTVIVE